MRRLLLRSARLSGLLFFAAALFLIGFVSVAAARGVSTSMTKPSDIESGTYRVLGYGCNSAQDISNVAILQREGVPYDVGLAPRSKYFGEEKVLVSGLSKDQALAAAENFVQCNPNATKTDVSAIHAADGTLVGYEVTPVFKPLAFGGTPGVDTTYSSRGNQVVATVTPDPLAQSNVQGGG